jgi:hypothetical protein
VSDSPRRPRHVTRNCCDGGKAILYVGIEEQGSRVLQFRSAPHGRIRLSDDIVQAGNAFDAAVRQAILRGESTNPFIRLLYSPVWSDLNKMSFALMELSANRDPVLLASIREQALGSLVEMARWKSIVHAIPAVTILGRMLAGQRRTSNRRGRASVKPLSTPHSNDVEQPLTKSIGTQGDDACGGSPCGLCLMPLRSPGRLVCNTYLYYDDSWL